MGRIAALFILSAASVFAGAGTPAPGRSTPSDEVRDDITSTITTSDEAEIGAVVDAMYASISGPIGVPRDWQRFERAFTDAAQLIGYFSAPGEELVVRQWTPDVFREQIGPFLVETGVVETETRRSIQHFGHIAHVFSTYRAVFTDGEATSVTGINSFQLIKTERGWKIQSLIWQQASEVLPLPREYAAETD